MPFVRQSNTLRVYIDFYFFQPFPSEKQEGEHARLTGQPVRHRVRQPDKQLPGIYMDFYFYFGTAQKDRYRGLH